MNGSRLRKGIFGAMTAAALAFGGTQAFAAPAGPAAARACDAYSDNLCRIQCQNDGYDTGTCQPGYCRCWFW